MKNGSLRYLTREGFKNIWKNKLMSFASVAVLLSCLVMMGSAFMVYQNVEKMIDSIDAENVVVVYIEDNATDAQIAALGNDIKSITNINTCEFVDKETAFKQQLASLDSDATYFEGVDNPLPDAYQVTIKDMSSFDKTVEELSGLTSVLSVRDSRNLAKTLVNIRSTVTYVSLGVIGLLLLVSLFIISNTVRITMFSRKLEISIMKSVGATNNFIRWPFVIEGVLLGIISSVLSLGVVWGIYQLLEGKIAEMLSTVLSLSNSLVDFKDYALPLLLAFVIVGILSGVVGSMVSIQKYLKEQGGVTYNEDE